MKKYEYATFYYTTANMNEWLFDSGSFESDSVWRERNLNPLSEGELLCLLGGEGWRLVTTHVTKDNENKGDLVTTFYLERKLKNVPSDSSWPNSSTHSFSE